MVEEGRGDGGGFRGWFGEGGGGFVGGGFGGVYGFGHGDGVGVETGGGMFGLGGEEKGLCGGLGEGNWEAVDTGSGGWCLLICAEFYYSQQSFAWLLRSEIGCGHVSYLSSSGPQSPSGPINDNGRGFLIQSVRFPGESNMNYRGPDGRVGMGWRG